MYFCPSLSRGENILEIMTVDKFALKAILFMLKFSPQHSLIGLACKQPGIQNQNFIITTVSQAFVTIVGIRT